MITSPTSSTSICVYPQKLAFLTLNPKNLFNLRGVPSPLQETTQWRLLQFTSGLGSGGKCISFSSLTPGFVADMSELANGVCRHNLHTPNSDRTSAKSFLNEFPRKQAPAQYTKPNPVLRKPCEPCTNSGRKQHPKPRRGHN